MSIDKKKFIEISQAHFQRLTPQLDAELAELSSRSWPEATRFLLIEYDSARFSSDFSVSLWAMDENGSPVDRSMYEFLAGTVVPVPREIYDYENYADDDEWDEVEPSVTASELLKQWFSERWRAHVSMMLPAYIGHHDSFFKTDLSTNSRTDWDAIVKHAKTDGSKRCKN